MRSCTDLCWKLSGRAPPAVPLPAPPPSVGSSVPPHCAGASSGQHLDTGQQGERLGRLAVPAVLASPGATKTVPGMDARGWGDGGGWGTSTLGPREESKRADEEHLNARICSACGYKLLKLLTHLLALTSYTWREQGVDASHENRK